MARIPNSMANAPSRLLKQRSTKDRNRLKRLDSIGMVLSVSVRRQSRPERLNPGWTNVDNSQLCGLSLLGRSRGVGQVFVLFAAWRAGQHRARGLAEDADGVAFIDGDQDTLVEQRIAIGVEKHEIGGPE